MLWLDFLTFGHGYGLAQPYFDGRFYWLVDTSQGREVGRGALYTFLGGHGAQLTSRQWFHPKPGEERTLIGRKFRPFNSSRRGLRVEVSWTTKLPKGIDEANAAIRQMRDDLHNDLMDPSSPVARTALAKGQNALVSGREDGYVTADDVERRQLATEPEECAEPGEEDDGSLDPTEEVLKGRRP